MKNLKEYCGHYYVLERLSGVLTGRLVCSKCSDVKAAQKNSNTTYMPKKTANLFLERLAEFRKNPLFKSDIEASIIEDKNNYNTCCVHITSSGDILREVFLISESYHSN